MASKLEKLQELIKIASDSLSREEFLENFKLVIDLVKKHKAQHEEMMKELDTKYLKVIEDTISAMKQGGETEMSEAKKEAMRYCEAEMKRMAKDLDRKMNEMKDGKDGKDGKDADVKECAEEAAKIVASMVPKIEEVEKDLPKLGEAIRDGLELLQGDERLEIKAIKDLREELDKLKEEIKRKDVSTHFVGGSSGGGRVVKSYDLSSVLDGVTKIFSLPAFYRIISVHSSSFPSSFRETVDYTYDSSAMTITFTDEITADSTLASGQTITVIFSE